MQRRRPDRYDTGRRSADTSGVEYLVPGCLVLQGRPTRAATSEHLPAEQGFRDIDEGQDPPQGGDVRVAGLDHLHHGGWQIGDESAVRPYLGTHRLGPARQRVQDDVGVFWTGRRAQAGAVRNDQWAQSPVPEQLVDELGGTGCNGAGDDDPPAPNNRGQPVVQSAHREAGLSHEASLRTIARQ